MINAKGIIQNNESITSMIKELKNNKNQYPTLNCKEERNLIEEYVSIAKDENGDEILDKESNIYQLYLDCDDSDELYKKSLYYLIPRKLIWHKNQDELMNLLMMHNIKYVFSIAKRYCKISPDFDNTVANGFRGLVYSTTKFNPYRPNTYKDKNDPMYKVDPKLTRDLVKFDENGEVEYTKFCTYAKNWILKYILDEFGKKSRKFIDNKSISMNDVVKIKNSTDNNQTMENYIDEMVSPDYIMPKTIEEQLSEKDVSDFYGNIQYYVKNTSELTSIEKQIILDTYYNHKTIREIAEECNINTQSVMNNKKKALNKIKNYLGEKFNIHEKSDLTVSF